MVLEFETERASKYVLNSILSFIGDPPDTEFQSGYLAALLDVYTEGLNKGSGDDRINYLANYIRGDASIGENDEAI